ncbi:MAG: serine hydrolase, partial [Acholeplasmataceae bacterium]|nr:serine hydrolase [Acholeplasmataceae bacterium]
MPAASLIKVFILAEAMDEVKAGNYKLEDEYKIDVSDIVEGSPALQNRQAGTKISFGTLLEKMITVNDNTATNMLIDILGMDTINEYI